MVVFYNFCQRAAALRSSEKELSVARIFFGILQNRSCTKGERSEPFVQRFSAWRSGGLEAQMFNFAQMPNRITNVQFSTSAPILPNPCCTQPFFVITNYCNCVFSLQLSLLLNLEPQAPPTLRLLILCLY
jgi:hypothetical protein